MQLTIVLHSPQLREGKEGREKERESDQKRERECDSHAICMTCFNVPAGQLDFINMQHTEPFGRLPKLDRMKEQGGSC